MKPWLKFVLEMGPLAVFFVANSRFGLPVGTACLMVATIASLVVTWLIARRIPTMPLVTAVFVLVFGGLTLYLKDERFIKMKPTFINLLFSAALFFGIATRRNLLKVVFDGAFHLDDTGWRILAWRWAFFFVFLAVLNEIVWRTMPTDFWVNFKVFATTPITMIFMMFQIGVINRHQIAAPAKTAPETESGKDW